VSGLLDGIRVLELGDEPVLFAGRMLGELGADVVLVEPPGGHAARRRQPFLEAPPLNEAAQAGESLYQLHFNAGKRGILLDESTEEGAATLRRLVGGADILLLTGTREVLAERGLDYASLSAAHAGLVHVSVTPFGSDGPMREHRANDLVISAMSGLMCLNGMPEDPPNLPGAEQAYHMASLVAASSALIAIVGRQADPEGRGREVTVSAQEATSMATLQTANANHYTWHGAVPKRNGLGGHSGRNLFQCADGKWISFTIPVGQGPLWGNFVQWLDDAGVPHEFTEEWFDPAFRQPRQATVHEAIERLVGGLPRDEVFHDGQRRRLLTMPVNDVADLFEDEQLRARDFFKPLAHPDLGRSFEIPGPAYHFSAAEAGITRAAPRLGEHTREVLEEWLGATSEGVA
jgi:benzylsuccinate CoA-transferase BbsE subunit